MTELNFSSSKKSKNSSNEDEELKKIIEELDNDAKRKNAKNTNEEPAKKSSSSNQRNSELDDALKLFGMNVNSTNDEIKSAYKKKMMQYHPDRVSHLGEDYIDAAKRKTVEFNQSYQVLKKFGKA